MYSDYERETIALVLGSMGRARDVRPEGKTVEGVDVAPRDVFETRDPLPRRLDVFHATTHPSIVQREILVHQGEPYRQALVDETIRNLRQLTQLSLVLVIATTGSTPDRVRLVVVTKDVWSLRLGWNVIGTPGGLEQLEVQPSEINLFGTHQTATATFILEPAAVTMGAGYQISRIGTSRVALLASANVMVNRQSGSPEGSFGSLVTGQPLYSGLADWAWDAATAWDDVVVRRYVNAALSSYVDPATGQAIPFEYRSGEYATKLELRRAFGWDTRHELTLSAGIVRDAYRIAAPGASARTVADFAAAAVPVSDTAVGPTIQYETYTKRYARLIDFDTLALQEDYRLGHDIVLAAGPRLRALGSSRDFVDLRAAAQYTFAVSDGLFRVAVDSVTDVEPGRISDASIIPLAHLATPTIAGLGRIVVDGRFDYRWRNYLNKTDYIGGDEGLRGFPTNYFVGTSYVVYSVEARSRPIELLSCQIAGVAFYDAGDAFYAIGSLRPYQSAGVGFRALFPWLDRVVFRADIGFPFERPIDPSTGAPVPPFGFIVSFGQAFDMPTVAPTPALPTEQVEVRLADP